MNSLKIVISPLFILAMIFSAYGIISDNTQNISYSQSDNATEVETINMTMTVTKTENIPINITITDKNGTQIIYSPYCYIDPETGEGCISEENPDELMCRIGGPCF